MAQLIQTLKDCKILPFEIEQLHIEGPDTLSIHYTILEKVLGKETLNEFYSTPQKEIKIQILKIYYPEIPELPKKIMTTADEARTATRFDGWALTQDWLAGIKETDEDKIMVDYIDKDIDRALKVYGYILHLEVGDYDMMKKLKTIPRVF